MTEYMPGALGGAIAVIEVGLFTMKAAAFGPNVTAVAPVKSVPVMVTGVPPMAGPVAGASEETVGGAI